MTLVFIEFYFLFKERRGKVICFKFDGFEPSVQLHRLAKQVLWSIENSSPSYSRLQASMKKEGKRFKGSIRVCYGKGCFEISAEDEKAEVLVETLKSGIVTKIGDWKKRRKVA